MEDSEMWRMSAACRGQDPAIFIPDTGDTRRATERAFAKALAFCDVCPVVGDCLEMAIRTGEETSGIYGNTTPRQRRKIRERRQARERAALAWA